MSFSQGSSKDSKAAPSKNAAARVNKLLVIDFDETISSLHIHNLIGTCMSLPENQSLRKKPEEEWKIAKDILPIGGAARWKKVFETAKDQGYKIAVASFNGYPHIVERYLKEIIGLKIDDLDRNIFLRVEFLKGYSKESNKNSYIRDSIEYFLFMGSIFHPKDITFIDDSKKNVTDAKGFGCDVILANKEGTHLQALENMLGISLTSGLNSKSVLFQPQPGESAAGEPNINQGAKSQPPKPPGGGFGAANG